MMGKKIAVISTIQQFKSFKSQLKEVDNIEYVFVYHDKVIHGLEFDGVVTLSKNPYLQSLEEKVKLRIG